MDILTFAHKGEAQAFLEKWDMDPSSNPSLKNSPLLSGRYFESQNLGLLITGEGFIESGRRLTHLLTLLLNQGHTVDRIINLGVAGALTSECEEEKLYAVRTVYAHNGREPLFHSVTCPTREQLTEFPQKDLVTSFERTLSAAKAEELSPFGTLVDREGQGIAQTAKTFHLPWLILKVVSDSPWKNSSGKSSFCEITKERSFDFSLKLFEGLQKIQKAPRTQEDESEIFRSLLNRSDLHFSRQMRRQLQQNLHNLEIKIGREKAQRLCEEYLSADDLPQRPKERSRELLQVLRNELTPFRGQMEKEIRGLLENRKKELRSQTGIKNLDLQMDSTLESPGMGVQLWLSSPEEQKALSQALGELDLTALLKLQNGEFGAFDD